MHRFDTIQQYDEQTDGRTEIGDIFCIEKVQRSFTKRLPGLNNLTYRERLVVTNLDSLEVRRLRVDLIMCYKIVFRLINVDFCAFFFVLQSLAILVAMVINCLPSSLPTMYAIILLLGVLLARGIDIRPMLIFPLSLASMLFLIVLICQIFCYIVLIMVDVSVPSGVFLSLAGIFCFYLCCWCCQCQC